MEKLIYILSRSDGETGEIFKERLISEFVPTINEKAEYIQINAVDDAVASSNLSRAGSEAANRLPQSSIADGALFLWLKSVSLAGTIEDSLKNFTRSIHGYLVTETEQLPNTTRVFSPVRRTSGFDQIAFLRKPRNQAYDDWLHNWQGLHTKVAIATQSTCRYIQNVVVRSLTPEAPDIQAIVEEGYPDESAMYDPMVFYGAQGNTRKMNEHIRLMMESCARFIDFESCPCDMIGMSQYIIKR